jgi:hypothetical protein
MNKMFRCPIITQQAPTIQVSRNEIVQKCADLFSPENDQLLENLAPSTRAAKLPVKTLIVASLYFILTPLSSFLRVLGTLQRSGLWFIPPIQVSKQAFFKRFRRFSPQVVLHFLNHLSSKFQTDALSFSKSHPVRQLIPFTQHLYSIDDSVLDDVGRVYFARQLKDEEPALSQSPGRITAVFDVFSGLIERVQFTDDPKENEKAHVREVLRSLPLGSLLLFDLGFFAFSFFDWLTNHSFYYVSRMKAGVSYETIETFIDAPRLRDRLIWLGKYRSDRAAHSVRFIEVKVGGEWWGYITNVLDPSVLPAYRLYALYNQRWTIECCFSVLKDVLGMGDLRLCSLGGALWQVWSTFLAYHIIQSIRVELAENLNTRPEYISWKNVLEAQKCYYLEAVGETEQSMVSWICEHHESFGLIIKSRKKRREVPDYPKELIPLSEKVEFCLEKVPKPREAKQSKRKCGKEGFRNEKQNDRKKIIHVGRVQTAITKGKKGKKPKRIQIFG